MKRILGCVFFIFALIISGCSSDKQNPPVMPISVSVTPANALVAPSGTTKLTATVMNDTTGVTWSVNGTAGGSSATGTIDAQGNYTAPAATTSVAVTATATSKADSTKSASAVIAVVVPGAVTATNNVQVAQYTINPPVNANVSIEFGPDTTYGLHTWKVATPNGGGAVSIYVAGMRAATLYHMRAIVELSDGTAYTDADQTFTTTAIPSVQRPNLTVTTTDGKTPQSGVEMLDLIGGSGVATALVTDLSGNILWAYPPVSGTVQPVRMLSNGNFLISFGPTSETYTPPNLPDNKADLREVDLGGNIVRHLTPTQLNTKLAASADASLSSMVINTIHHDAIELPNHHLMILANTTKQFTDVTGFPGVSNVLGDVLVELQPDDTTSPKSWSPVWVWSEFDHLDVNRHPMLFPDWTHSNALLYSPDDGNILVSVRHQHWVIKIDYRDGAGTGDLLWKLGVGGDFTLTNGTDPTDWFYAQHNPTFASVATAGNFELVLMDNGDNRPISGTPCVSNCYTTVPVLQINETDKTATIQFRDTLPQPQYSNFAGSANTLANGNVEFTLASQPPGTNANIYEVTREDTPQIIWNMHVTGQYAYRGFRMPSFYPGVQW